MIKDIFKGFAKLFTFVENLGLLTIQESDKTLMMVYKNYVLII